MNDVALRKTQLQAELDRILPIIRSQYQPERIILFGSFLNDSIGEWSDLDIAIIKRTDKRFLDRLLEVARLIHSRVATDVIVYTPQEFEEMADDNYFVREEIVQKGKIVYDKDQPN